MKINLEERPDKNWNERVLKSMNCHFQQTTEYANYIQKRGGKYYDQLIYTNLT